MATARLQKEKDAEALRQELAEVPSAILVDFRGLDVAGATDLRRRLRDGESGFRVVKNSVALRAIEGLPLGDLSDAFVGQTAIAYTEGDIVGLAKTLREFAKEYETPSFKAGIVDGAAISAEEFEQLAKLPPRDQLIAQALYLMNYPITGLVTALSAILSGFVTVLDQIRDQKEQAGDVAAGEEPAAADAPDEPEKAAADETSEPEATTADEPGEPEPAAKAGDETEAAEPATEKDEPKEASAEEPETSDESDDTTPAEDTSDEAAEDKEEE